MNKLKQCPFCGAEHNENDMFYKTIECSHCGVIIDFYLAAPARKDMIKSYNTRPIEEELGLKIIEILGKYDKLSEEYFKLKSEVEDVILES